MRNIKITISYDGTNYSGTQKQKNALTIQEVLEKSLEKITNEKIKTIFAGRTDAGVHAKAQVVNFKTNSSIPVEKFPPALNSVLPKDIVVIGSEEVALEFHSRYDAKSKVYKYLILNTSFCLPFYRRYAYWVPEKLDLEKMEKAAIYFLGKKDFTYFCKKGSSVKNKICEIYNLKIKKNKDLIEIEIKANRFLYGMVRMIVGTLIEVGKNKIKPEEVKEILKGEKKVQNIAPPQGLYLIKVNY
jgi:tRNA pseudouridine38-40 synthase